MYAIINLNIYLVKKSTKKKKTLLPKIYAVKVGKRIGS